MSTRLRTWDIFCHVVDNFGDVGLCWRLARELTHEHAVAVRLWVDELASLARIAPELDPSRDVQMVQGVRVSRWTPSIAWSEVPDVVVEAFGCELPAAYVQAMAARDPKPAWINLEYLSAENWVEGSHTRPSPHPRLPLTKYFFFPGFTPHTGGLLHERGLLGRRDAFRANAQACAALWRQFGLGLPRANEIRVSLFCYDNEAIAPLLDAWAVSDETVTCIVPAAQAAQRVLQHLGATSAASSTQVRRGHLLTCIAPFVTQDQYDELLWVCDFNFVRGEDSFVRAQWAGRPFVWHIYPQHDGAHWKKLDAFLERYTTSLDAPAAHALRNFWRAWNRGDGSPWSALRFEQPRLQDHANAWAATLAQEPDLAEKLVQLVATLL